MHLKKEGQEECKLQGTQGKSTKPGDHPTSAFSSLPKEPCRFLRAGRDC